MKKAIIFGVGLTVFLTVSLSSVSAYTHMISRDLHEQSILNSMSEKVNIYFNNAKNISISQTNTSIFFLLIALLIIFMQYLFGISFPF